ncbi:MAG: response regulator [Myxococcota bacterium]
MTSKRSLRFLIVHPDEQIALDIGKGVRAAGHQPTFVFDGEQAIDHFVQHPVDGILIELVLPGRDGVATIESIRWAPGGRDLPTILIGSYLNEGEVWNAAAELGVDNVLLGVPGSAEIQNALTRLETHFASVSPAMTGKALRRLVGDPIDDPTLDRATSTEWIDPPDTEPDRELQYIEDLAKQKTHPRLTGTLADLPLPKLLARLAEQEATGALTLRACSTVESALETDEACKILYFHYGVVRAVYSNLRSERLGNRLRSSGRIDEANLEKALARVHSGEGRLGEILISVDALTPEELRSELDMQQREKLFELFRWAEGRFEFHDESAPNPVVQIDLSVSEIIFHGVVFGVSQEILLEQLQPHLHKYVVPVPRRAAPFFGMQLHPSVRTAVKGATGSRTLTTVLKTAAPHTGAVTQLLYAMESVGAITYRSTPTYVRTESFRNTGEIGAPLTGDKTVLKKELGNANLLFEQGRDLEAIGVGRDADLVTLHQACMDLEARIRRATLPGSAPRDVRVVALKALAHLIRFQGATGLGIPTEEIPLTDEHSKPDLEQNDSGLNVLSGHADEEDSGVIRGLIRVKNQVKEPLDDPFTTAGVHAREPDLRFQRLGLAVRDIEREVDILTEAEQLFREGKMAETRGDRMGAQAAFERAVALCPEEGEFVSRLGYLRFICSADDPNSQAKAVDEFPFLGAERYRALESGLCAYPISSSLGQLALSKQLLGFC